MQTSETSSRTVMLTIRRRPKNRDHDKNKVVLTPATFDDLKVAFTNFIENQGFEMEQLPVISYHNNAVDIVVEDNDDYTLARTIALSDNRQLNLSVKLFNKSKKGEKGEEQVFAATESPDENEEETKQEAPAQKGRRAEGKKDKGIPRKALKSLIKSALEQQATEAFKTLLKSKDLDGAMPQAEPSSEQEKAQALVEHTNVECDGCGTAPIKGIRFKCSVCKNFDYCQLCEERLGHEHAFVQIREDGGAPETMITILGEDAPQTEEEQKDGASTGEDILNQFLDAMKGGRGNGCHMGGNNQNGGRGGRGGCGRGRGGFKFGPRMKHMINDFLSKMDIDPEQIQKHMQDWQEDADNKQNQNCRPKWDKQGWKMLRAVILNKPTEVFKVVPGQEFSFDIEVMNDTYWPWKSGCQVTLAEEQSSITIPVYTFAEPVTQEVRGKSSVTVKVPLKVLDYAVASDSVYEIFLTFRGPKGQSFGAPIPIKLQVVLPEQPQPQAVPQQTASSLPTAAHPETAPSDQNNFNVFKLAIKLHEAGLGTFDECVKAVRENDCSEAQSVKALQRN